MAATAAAEVAGGNAQWGEMMKAGNSKGIADLYTSECRILAPGAPPVIGNDAFQKLVEGFITGGCTGAKLTTDEIQADADHTPEGGTFWERGNITLFKSDDVMYAGKYVAIWKKVDNKLRIDIDIWNSNGQ